MAQKKKPAKKKLTKKSMKKVRGGIGGDQVDPAMSIPKKSVLGYLK